MRLVSVFSPATDGEQLAIIELLEALEVPCFVQSTSAGSPSSAVLGAQLPRTILVPAQHSAEALRLSAGLRASCDAQYSARLPRSRGLRSFIDLIAAGWFRLGRDA